MFCNQVPLSAIYKTYEIISEEKSAPTLVTGYTTMFTPCYIYASRSTCSHVWLMKILLLMRTYHDRSLQSHKDQLPGVPPMEGRPIPKLDGVSIDGGVTDAGLTGVAAPNLRGGCGVLWRRKEQRVQVAWI